MAQITEVEVRPVEGHAKLKAYARIVLDGEWAIHGITLVDMGDRLLVSMPNEARGSRCEACAMRGPAHAPYCAWCGRSKRMRARKLYDVVHPIDRGVREELERRVVEEYEVARSNVEDGSTVDETRIEEAME